MFDDLAAYYHENVISAYVDYRDIKQSDTAGRSRDVRSAVIAATALFHMRDHLPDKVSRRKIEKLCPEYGLLGDIVNASKHRSLSSSTPHGDPLVTDATQIFEQIFLTEYEDEKGTYNFKEKKVSVKLNDGSERDLFEILTTVVNFWEEYLHSLGTIPEIRKFPFEENVRIKTRPGFKL